MREETDVGGKVYTREEPFGIVRLILERYNIRSASLFESHACKDATLESDIDALVYAGDSFLFDVLAVAEDLHRAMGKDVDVYEISELKPGAFRSSILAEAIELCEKTDACRIRRILEIGHQLDKTVQERGRIDSFPICKHRTPVN